MSRADDLEAFLNGLGDEKPTAALLPIASPNPVKAAALEALESFVTDGLRVRSQEVAGEWYAFLVTTKPHEAVGPTIHGGVEPEKLVEASTSLIEIEARKIVKGREHRVWTLLVGNGLLLRIWSRKPDEDRNGEVAYWIAKRNGECKRVDQVVYQQLRKAMR